MDESKNSYNTNQYIVIKIGQEQYGIDIQYIDNIVRMQKITRVPKVQTYFKGVINLRGEIIPVMSIRLKMGLSADVITNSTRIIILKPEQQSALGIIVDEVKEVVTIEDKNTEKLFYNTKDDTNSYISTIGKHNDELISILDLNTIVNG